MAERPCASLSLDLDNQWSYMKTHGEKGWEAYPSYLDTVVPIVLKFLAARDLKISFFIVGQDAALERNVRALRAIADAGHEIGNHSFKHEPWLHLYSDAELDEELGRAEAAIEQATGKRPVGFRGPGFSLSAATLRVLAARGYLYDCSVFPNLLNPLARAYYFASSRLTPEEKAQRSQLFGKWTDAFKPLRPYNWDLDGRSLLEIPVTTMPLFKVPIHLSYVLFLGRFSVPLARAYFRFALLMCRLTGTEPSILLHPLDFLGKEDVSALAFFPGMDMPRDKKLAIAAYVIDALTARYEVLTMRGHAERVAQRGGLVARPPEPAAV